MTVFTPEGQFVRAFEVQNPSGLTVDSAGFSFVTKCTRNYNCYEPDDVSIFDPNGQLIHELKGFQQPQDIKISSDGSVWISECGGHKVSKY